ncbi:MAG: hypothetical protein QOC71_985 [Thermoplasmata archaeon]|nr:hypothetical protein [Thermoplasmata archaeon]
MGPTKGNTPLVSVVIPTYNSDPVLVLCLEALARQTYPADRTEVLVVDNGSTETDAAMRARFPQVRWLSEPQPGSYAARNRGLREAKGDVLAFTDADCLPAPDWLERGVAALQADPGLGMVAGHVELFPRDPRHPTGAELWDMQYGLNPRQYLEEMHFGATANLFTRPDVVAAVGPFDATLKSSGDREWGERAWAAGVRQAFRADVHVKHPARVGLRALAAKTRRIRGGYADRGHLPRGWPLARRWIAHALPPARILPATRRIGGQHGATAAIRFYGAYYYRRLVLVAEEVRLAMGGTSRR